MKLSIITVNFTDYKWFIEAVIYHGASYSFYPKAVSFVDGGGISSIGLLLPKEIN